MNINRKRLLTEFGPDTRFEVKPTPPAPFRASHEDGFERLKNRLLEERLAETWGTGFTSNVRRAANEAAALAWITPYPLLVFPVLFEEKADAALRVAERQVEVRMRSRELLAV
ncbi:MAG TPA: hypothetical protein VEC99_08955 [Clostridia bacterium]|nr:hypothetical protein [Clostridia bacterium]